MHRIPFGWDEKDILPPPDRKKPSHAANRKSPRFRVLSFS